MSLRSLFLKTNFRVIDSNSLSLAGKLRKLYRFVENLLYCETDNDTPGSSVPVAIRRGKTTAFLFVMFGDMYISSGPCFMCFTSFVLLKYLGDLASSNCVSCLAYFFT